MSAIVIGRRFGRLVVTALHPERRVSVVCDCGTPRNVFAGNLLKGATTSCGCYMRQRAHECNFEHGLGGTPENRSWNSALARCYNPRNKAFKHYGARGIVMCDRWRNDFMAFLADMGPRPKGRYTLDRIDNDGPYSPENCRWATDEQQANNRRSSLRITALGRTASLSEWAAETGLAYDTIKQRINKLGWAPDRALTTPSRPRRAA